MASNARAGAGRGVKPFRLRGRRQTASDPFKRGNAFHACFILNTLFFSQAFFSLLLGHSLIIKLLRTVSIVTRRGQQMTQPRLYKRVTPSGRMSATGQIIVGPKLPALTCRVVDYSAGGACLDIYGLGAVPDRFEFHYGGVKKKSHVVWRRGIRIGVAF